MIVSTDIHAHSGYAGGVGKIDFSKLINTMEIKGIDIYGTGDCLHPKWFEFLKGSFSEEETGLFSLNNVDSKKRFMLQTEIIVTVPVREGRKINHTIMLFPDFESIEKTVELFDKWGVKNTIGRPFIKCEFEKDVSDKFYQIREINDLIEMIPAHVMTPQGVLGSLTPVKKMQDVYGEYVSEISAVETGLSADPDILSLIPELDNINLISNSDAHSFALNRVGREFTSFDINRMDYKHVIEGIRKNKIVSTAEFDPLEGRYFLTGHRGDKKGHDGKKCVYSPKHTPGKKCPICGKNLTIGVLDRAFELGEIQEGKAREIGHKVANRKDFLHIVPMVEIIAYSLGVKSVTSKRIESTYYEIASILPETKLWFLDKNKLENKLVEKKIDQKIIDSIIKVKEGNFGYMPPGFDGTYGELVIGKKPDYLNVKIEEK